MHALVLTCFLFCFPRSNWEWGMMSALRMREDLEGGWLIPSSLWGLLGLFISISRNQWSVQIKGWSNTQFSTLYPILLKLWRFNINHISTFYVDPLRNKEEYLKLKESETRKGCRKMFLLLQKNQMVWSSKAVLVFYIVVIVSYH